MAMNSLPPNFPFHTTDVELAMNSLPLGFRFHPTDVELVWYYLKIKVMGMPLQAEIISEVDLYKLRLGSSKYSLSKFL
jgi:hypothetical protein